MNSDRLEPARQCVQQVGAVKAVVGGAVAFRELEPIVEFEEPAGQHVARIDARRQVPDSSDPVADADRPEGLDSLRARVDGGADLAQSRRGFENLSLDAEALQRLRGRDSRKPAANNRYYSLKPSVPLDACRHIQGAKKKFTYGQESCFPSP